MRSTHYRALLSVICTVLFVAVYAQKTKVYDGSFDALKGEKKLNVVYDYSKMSVGDFDTETAYLEEKSAERNKDAAGSGDAWVEAWKADRKNKFEPKFEELFNEYMSGNGMKCGNYPDAKYTLILKTTHTEPGWNVGVMRKSAHINADLWLVETGNMDKVLGKMSMEKVPGRDAWGMDFDTGYRLQESYALTGKTFAKYLDKKVM